MPLKEGYSDKTKEANIGELISSGFDPKQAAAIAYQKVREAKEKAGKEKPKGPNP